MRSKQWITRPGKLGGKGFLSKSPQTQHKLLTKCVNKYNYRSCLGSLMVLNRNREIKRLHGKKIDKLKKWLKMKYGGPGSFGFGNRKSKRKPKRKSKSKRKRKSRSKKKRKSKRKPKRKSKSKRKRRSKSKRKRKSKSKRKRKSKSKRKRKSKSKRKRKSKSKRKRKSKRKPKRKSKSKRKRKSKRKPKRKSKSKRKRKSKSKRKRKSKSKRKRKSKSKRKPKRKSKSKRKRKSKSKRKRRSKKKAQFKFGEEEIVIYTHPTNDQCPSCVGAKQYLRKKGIVFKAVRGKNNGQPNPRHPTWPKIYINKKFIGGFKELQTLK